jgi:hypothetical protein
MSSHVSGASSWVRNVRQLTGTADFAIVVSFGLACLGVGDAIARQ